MDLSADDHAAACSSAVARYLPLTKISNPGRRLTRTFSFFCAVVLGASVAAGQLSDGGLPRRPWLGVALAPHDQGVLVTSVVEGSSAAASGVRAGDVIRSVDNAAVREPAAVIAAIGRHASGETTTIEILRGGATQTQTMALQPFPRETLPDTTFEYGAVTIADGSRLRTILSTPARSGTHPAVMLLQGGGCGSVDVPMAADTGTTGLLRDIAAQGYATMRVEKSGIGDSRGPACDTIGYTQELDGYRAALAALKQSPAVDADQIVLLGISLGGVFAPVVASESRVRGIVVYGTLGSAPSPYAGRAERFFREFASADIKAAWSNVSARVLVLHGQFDDTVAVVDHTQIAPWVNASNPGAATHRVLDGLDHCWTRHPSMEASRGRCGEGDAVPDLSDAIPRIPAQHHARSTRLSLDVSQRRDRMSPSAHRSVDERSLIRAYVRGRSYATEYGGVHPWPCNAPPASASAS